MKPIMGALLLLLLLISGCNKPPPTENNQPTLDDVITPRLGTESPEDRTTIHGTDQPPFYLDGVLQDPAAWPSPELDQIDTILVLRGRDAQGPYGSAAYRGVIHVILKESAREWDPFVGLIPPSGYRAIARSEYSVDWHLVEERFPAPDRAGGDFDGDGETDLARLWIHEDGEKWVLMAYLSGMPDLPVEVYQSDHRVELDRRPIWAIPPGDHKTHRYYGIGPGHGDTTAVVHLTHSAIALGYTESEGTTFVWNKEAKVFDPIAMH